MKVAVRVRGTVVVDNDVDTLDIDTATKDVSGDQNTLLKCLEGSVPRDTDNNCRQTPSPLRRPRDLPLLLHKARMDGDTREVARHKELVELNGTRNGLHKDDDLNRALSLHENFDEHSRLTWLKSSVSRSSFNFLFLPTSSIFT